MNEKHEITFTPHRESCAFSRSFIAPVRRCCLGDRMSVGNKVKILVGWMKGEWGIIRKIDGNEYHVALYNGNECLLFNKKELRIIK